MHYVGRFAPSPTGPLHLGSLSTALASYLDAKANSGHWQVRIEDIDPPREQPGATTTILHQLEQHALEWDGEIRYQSQRHDRYRDLLADLERRGLTYPCSCNRSRLARLPDGYDRHCLLNPPRSGKPSALRVHNELDVDWNDLFQGEQHFTPAQMGGDFIVRRKDDLISYQLAVAVDDGETGISRVVRGADLLDSTPRQLVLIRLLGLHAPEYGHVPVVTDAAGNKLSKQQGAEPVDSLAAVQNLRAALHLLGQPAPDPAIDQPSQLLATAVAAWLPAKLTGRREACAPAAV